jgi:EPS-associated MarR family transcriptional regulator
MPAISRHNQEDLRFRVLRILSENPKVSLRELASRLGVSLGGISYCVGALVDKGHVKVDNFRASDNKLRYMYILTPHGLSEKAALTGRFLMRKMAEYEALRAEIEAVEKEIKLFSPLIPNGEGQ